MTRLEEVLGYVREALVVHGEHWTEADIQRAAEVAIDLAQITARQLAGDDVTSELRQAESAALLIAATSRRIVARVLRGTVDRILAGAVQLLFGALSGL